MSSKYDYEAKNEFLRKLKFSEKEFNADEPMSADRSYDSKPLKIIMQIVIFK
jgi:hypothetical protein